MDDHLSWDFAFGCSFYMSYQSWEKDPFILCSTAELEWLQSFQRCGISPEAFNATPRKQDEDPM